MTAASRQRRALAVALVALGLLALGGAGSLYLENDLAHYGQATYVIAPADPGGFEPRSSVPDDATVVDYGELPPRAQAGFDAARRGESLILWGQDDRRAIDAIEPYSGAYVQHQGQYYEILLLVGHRGPGYWQRGLLEFLAVAALGLGLIGAGARAWIAGR